MTEKKKAFLFINFFKKNISKSPPFLAGGSDASQQKERGVQHVYHVNVTHKPYAGIHFNCH